MATNFDLEEQEQLDQLKHFWNTYGTLITAILVAAALAYLGWSGWQYYQRNQAVQASALYDELQRSVSSGEPERIERAFNEMKTRFPGSDYAGQAGLIAAKVLHEKGREDAAHATLAWVAEKASDPGHGAIARLRLAAELLDAKSYDEALKQLSGTWPKEFEALAADRRGDIHLAQGKREEARAEYQKAWSGLRDDGNYRALVGIKLNAVGVDPLTLDAGPAAAAPKKDTEPSEK